MVDRKLDYLYIQNGQISGKPRRVWKTKGEWWLWIYIRDDRLQIPLHTWELMETSQRKKIPTRSFSWWDFFVDNNSELINLKIWRQLGIGCLQNIKQVYLMSRILMFIGIAYRSFCVSVEIVWTTGNTEVGIIVHVYWCLPFGISPCLCYGIPYLKGKPLNVKTKPLKFLYYLVIKAV